MNKSDAKHRHVLPSFDRFWKRGIVKVPGIGAQAKPILADFRADPEKYPLKTPSGKIEIYSERLARIAKTWDLRSDERIAAIPKFTPTFEMPQDPLAQKYPLQCFGYHGHGRTHSTYHNVPWLREL